MASSGGARVPPAEASLPRKLQGTFRQMLKLYDERKNKKALKLAEQILKEAPAHGETVATRALISYLSFCAARSRGEDTSAFLGKEEAFAEARRGLKLALRSPTTWHIMGVLHRHEKEYDDAVTYFRQAVRADPANAFIARDLTTLLLQTRNFESLVEIRRAELHARFDLRQNWTAYAFAVHMAGRPEFAGQLVRALRRQFFIAPPAAWEERWQRSQLALYELQLWEEAGLLPQCLRSLDECRSAGLFASSELELRAEGRVALFLFAETGELACLRRAHGAFRKLSEFLKHNEKLALLLALATSPGVAPSALFPTTSGEAAVAGGAAGLAAGAGGAAEEASAPNAPPASAGFKQTDVQPGPWLAVSVFALKSPLLLHGTPHNWTRPPLAQIYPGFAEPSPGVEPSAEGEPSAEISAYRQLRPLSSEEERAVVEFLAAVVADAWDAAAREEAAGATAPEARAARRPNADAALCLLTQLLHAKSPFFAPVVRTLLVPKIERGSYCAVNLVKNLLKADSKKREAVEKVLRELKAGREAEFLTSELPTGAVAALEACAGANPRDRAAALSASEKKVVSIVLDCSLAGICDIAGRFDEGIDLMNRLIAAAPTVVELYLMHARLLKHAGRVEEAAAALLEARELDLQDRYINTKCVKYALAAAGDAEAFAAVASMNDIVNMAEYYRGAIAGSYVDLQNMKFELRLGACLMRRGDLCGALRQYHFVLTHIEESRNDLMDFHLHCHRRFAFPAYIDSFRSKERIYAHRFYREAAANYVDILLRPAHVREAAKKAHCERKDVEMPKPWTLEGVDPATLMLTDDAAALEKCLEICQKLREHASSDIQSSNLLFRVASAAADPVLQMQALYRIYVLHGRNVLAPQVISVLSQFIITAKDAIFLENNAGMSAVRRCVEELLAPLRIRLDENVSHALAKAVARQDVSVHPHAADPHRGGGDGPAGNRPPEPGGGRPAAPRPPFRPGPRGPPPGGPWPEAGWRRDHSWARNPGSGSYWVPPEEREIPGRGRAGGPAGWAAGTRPLPAPGKEALRTARSPQIPFRRLDPPSRDAAIEGLVPDVRTPRKRWRSRSSGSGGLAKDATAGGRVGAGGGFSAAGGAFPAGGGGFSVAASSETARRRQRRRFKKQRAVELVVRVSPSGAEPNGKQDSQPSAKLLSEASGRQDANLKPEPRAAAKVGSPDGAEGSELLEKTQSASAQLPSAPKTPTPAGTPEKRLRSPPPGKAAAASARGGAFSDGGESSSGSSDGSEEEEVGLPEDRPELRRELLAKLQASLASAFDRIEALKAAAENLSDDRAMLAAVLMRAAAADLSAGPAANAGSAAADSLLGEPNWAGSASAPVGQGVEESLQQGGEGNVGCSSGTREDSGAAGGLGGSRDDGLGVALAVAPAFADAAGGAADGAATAAAAASAAGSHPPPGKAQPSSTGAAFVANLSSPATWAAFASAAVRPSPEDVDNFVARIRVGFPAATAATQRLMDDLRGRVRQLEAAAAAADHRLAVYLGSDGDLAALFGAERADGFFENSSDGAFGATVAAMALSKLRRVARELAGKIAAAGGAREAEADDAEEAAAGGAAGAGGAADSRSALLAARAAAEEAHAHRLERLLWRQQMSAGAAGGAAAGAAGSAPAFSVPASGGGAQGVPAVALAALLQQQLDASREISREALRLQSRSEEEKAKRAATFLARLAAGLPGGGTPSAVGAAAAAAAAPGAASGGLPTGRGEGGKMYEALRAKVVCSLCSDRWKNTALKSCGHCFCNVCIEASLATRNRKCPHCHLKYNAGDVFKAFLVS